MADLPAVKEKRMEVHLLPNERIDDLQRNGLRIIQDPKKFCFGIDAVLLAEFAAARAGDRVLDLGTGTGVIPLLMSSKTEAAFLAGLEIQEESAEMAGRSVAMNSLTDRIRIVAGDIREADRYFAPASFDVVTCNPPYMNAGHGLVNPQDAKALARHEITCTLEDACRAAGSLLRPGGRFYMVHRPSRLAEIITTLQSFSLEPKRMRFVYPYIDREPNLVLVESVRGGRSGMRIDKPLIVYLEPGVYTEEIRRIYD